MICPACGQSNIDGTDWCQACSESLTAVPPKRRAKPLLERRIESTTLASLNPAIPVCVAPDETVHKTLQLLAARNIGCVLVVEAGRLLGIFTERDALMKIGTRLSDLRERPIREFMTPHPETLTTDASVAYAINRMAVGGYRHVPLTAGEQAAGVISVRDVIRYVTQQFPELLADRVAGSSERA